MLKMDQVDQLRTFPDIATILTRHMPQRGDVYYVPGKPGMFRRIPKVRSIFVTQDRMKLPRGAVFVPNTRQLLTLVGIGLRLDIAVTVRHGQWMAWVVDAPKLRAVSTDPDDALFALLMRMGPKLQIPLALAEAAGGPAPAPDPRTLRHIPGPTPQAALEEFVMTE